MQFDEYQKLNKVLQIQIDAAQSRALNKVLQERVDRLESRLSNVQVQYDRIKILGPFAIMWLTILIVMFIPR